MEYQIITDVDNVTNVDFLPNLFDCSLARVQVRVNLSRHFAFAAPCNPTQNFAGFLTFLCDFSRNSTPLVHPTKNEKPHNQTITRLSLYPERNFLKWQNSEICCEIC